MTTIKSLFRMLVGVGILALMVWIDSLITHPIRLERIRRTEAANLINQPIERVENLKACTYLTVNKGEYVFSIDTHNKDLYYRDGFEDFVKAGDFVTKKTHNDTICITRNGVNHYWQIDTSQYYNK